MSTVKVSDVGGESVTLRAKGISFPEGRIVRVEFYQAVDGDSEFDETASRFLGSDEVPEDGWSLTFVTSPVLGQTSTRFFARAVIETWTSTVFSPVVALDVDVHETPTIEWTERLLGRFGALPEPEHIAVYQEQKAALLHESSGPGLYLQRLQHVDEFGVGDPISNPVRITDQTPDHYQVQVDAEGNATIVMAFEARPTVVEQDGEIEYFAHLWLARYDQQNRLFEEPVILAQNGRWANFTFAMNSAGIGAVDQLGEEVLVETSLSPALVAINSQGYSAFASEYSVQFFDSNHQPFHFQLPIFDEDF